MAGDIRGGFGRALRATREAIGISLETVALVGGNMAHRLRDVEAGDVWPPHPVLFRYRDVAELLGVDPTVFQRAAHDEWMLRDSWPKRASLLAAVQAADGR